MESADVILKFTRLFIGGVAAFFSIFLWSKTRDIAWVFIIIGTLVFYIEIVLTTLEYFGILREDAFYLYGFPVMKLILFNFPLLFFTIAFIIIISRGGYR